MVRPLTTDKTVWIILGTICAILSIFFALFFYLFTISIPFVIGLCMLFITKRLMVSYKLKKHHLKPKFHKYIRIILISLFWIISAFVLISYTQNQVESIAHDVEHPQNIIAETIVHEIETFFGTGHSDEHGNHGFLNYFFHWEEIEHLLHEVRHIIINCVLIIPLLFAYYFYKSKRLKEYTLQLVPVAYKSPIEKAMHRISNDLGTYFMSKVRSANAMFLMSALGFYVIGLKGAFFLALLAAAFSTIPHIGMLLAALASITVAGLQHPMNEGGDYLFLVQIDAPTRMFMVAMILVLALVIHNIFLKKYFVSERIHVDHLLDIVFILAAAKFLGVMGMFFIIPIYIVYKTVLKEFYGALTKSH